MKQQIYLQDACPRRRRVASLISIKSKIICLFCCFFLSFLNPVYSQWVLEDTLHGDDGFFQFISVADSSVVWAAGSSWSTGEKLIYKRNVSGQWNIVPLNGIPGSQSFTCLAAINSQTAIIGVGYGNAALYRTTNAGLNWQLQVSTGGSYGYFNDIRFSRKDPSYGYAWSDPPLGNGTAFKIYKSSNYGANWNLYEVTLNSNFIGASPSICVTDSNHAWFGLNKNIGGNEYGKILFTTNGCISFSIYTLPLAGRFVRLVEFKDNNLLGFSTMTEQGSYYFKSSNSGLNWNSNNSIFDLGTSSRIISIPNSSIWYAITTSSGNNRILKSSNDGITWFPMQVPVGQYVSTSMDAILINN